MKAWLRSFLVGGLSREEDPSLSRVLQAFVSRSLWFLLISGLIFSTIRFFTNVTWTSEEVQLLGHGCRTVGRELTGRPSERVSQMMPEKQASY